MTRTSPTVIINPRGDARFSEAVERLMADVTSTDELQMQLREHFPRTVVRRRGLAGEQVEVWYVYREGRWVTGA